MVTAHIASHSILADWDTTASTATNVPTTSVAATLSPVLEPPFPPFPCAVVATRDEATLQAVVDQTPQATTYYSDGFPTYQTLVYGLTATTPHCRIKAKRIRWKAGMPICATIWHGLGASRAVSHDAL